MLGKILKNIGIKTAVKNANKKQKSWADKAYFILETFVKEHKGSFMCEDVRAYAEKTTELTSPPSKRAWGGVMVRAKAKGLITSVGYNKVTNPKAHQANASMWKAC